MSKSREYRVTWQIDVDGTGPVTAAQAAAEHARHADQGVFEVAAGGSRWIIDLEERPVVARQIRKRQPPTPPTPPTTVSRTIKGYAETMALVTALMERGQWVDVRPWPTNKWVVTTGISNAEWMKTFGQRRVH